MSELTRARSTQLTELVTTNSTSLLKYFLRRTENSEDAADLLSDTYLVAWRQVRTLPSDPESARIWLFGVAQNTLRNHRRSTRRRAALVEAFRLSISKVASSQTDQSDRRIDTRAAISTLPGPQRELVLLVYGDGVSSQDAAKLLKIPASTARSRHTSAKESLANLLAWTTSPSPGESP